MSNNRNLTTEIMRNASRKGAKETTIETPKKTISPEPVEVEIAVTPKKVHETPKVNKELPTAVVQIAREGVPSTSYGIKPVATNFNCYNKEVFRWLREFSSSNQFSGGVPITKSQVIEIALDVLLYDLDITPIGYNSQDELRKDIQNKIRSGG